MNELCPSKKKFYADLCDIRSTLANAVPSSSYLKNSGERFNVPIPDEQ
jgi:hypothetical protein